MYLIIILFKWKNRVDFQIQNGVHDQGRAEGSHYQPWLVAPTFKCQVEWRKSVRKSVYSYETSIYIYQSNEISIFVSSFFYTVLKYNKKIADSRTDNPSLF